MLQGFGSNREVGILSIFTRELNIPIKTSDDIEKVIGIMEKLLAGDSILSMQIPEEESALVNRVVMLKNMMTWPAGLRGNTIVIEALRSKMRGMVEDKAKQLKSLKACEEHCQRVLPGLSPDQVSQR